MVKIDLLMYSDWWADLDRRGLIVPELAEDWAPFMKKHYDVEIITDNNYGKVMMREEDRTFFKLRFTNSAQWAN